MQLEKPRRVHIIVRDPQTKKSTTETVYNTTPEAVWDRIRQALASDETPETKKRPAAA